MKKKRSVYKYPSLEPKINIRNRCDEINDLCEYKDLLSDSEKEWLNSFSKEEICANLSRSKKLLNNASNPKVRSRIYNRNNERNRCIYTKAKSSNVLIYMGKDQEKFLDNYNNQGEFNEFE